MALSELNATRSVMEMLEDYGPTSQCEPVPQDRATEYVRELARGHYENFSVLSRFVPVGLVDDVAAVYAFCRWADDLGDETGTGEDARARSLELLSWWRGELRGCYETGGHVWHPVFVALRQTIIKHDLPMQVFDDLIRAFEQDQRVCEYETWDELLGYCKLSADPVGRLVLMLSGLRPPDEDVENADVYRMSDSICSALQLTNFWQDVRRDLVERDRVYLPSRETGVDGQMLRDWLNRGNEPEVRLAFIKALRQMVDRTWPMFEAGRELPGLVPGKMGSMVWLFYAGGTSVLRRVERVGCTTLWTRPRLGKAGKAGLLLQAWVMGRRRGLGTGKGERR